MRVRSPELHQVIVAAAEGWRRLRIRERAIGAESVEIDVKLR